MSDQERLDLIDKYKDAVINLTAGLDPDGDDDDQDEDDQDANGE